MVQGVNLVDQIFRIVRRQFFFRSMGYPAIGFIAQRSAGHNKDIRGAGLHGIG